MKGEEWWRNLFGQMDAYADADLDDVIARIADLGYDARAIYVVAFRHAAKEGLDEEETHRNAAWMCFGIELGIRAERAARLEEQVG